MGLTFVSVSPENSGSGITSVTATWSPSSTTGSLLLAHCLATAGTMSVTDTVGNTWIPLGTVSGSAQVFYAINVLASGGPVTLHSTASATLTIFVAEYTGQAAGANPIDVILGESAWTEVGTGTVNFGSVTTRVTNETLILFGRSGIGATVMTAQDGSTVRSTSNVLLQDRNVAVVGTYPSAFSTSSSGNTGPASFFAVKTPSSALAVYSQPDCRVAPFGPNTGVTVQGTIQYTKQTSSNAAIPPVDSRAAGAPVDSRHPAFIRQNSRTPGTFGPGN